MTRVTDAPHVYQTNIAMFLVSSDHVDCTRCTTNANCMTIVRMSGYALFEPGSDFID